MGSPVKPANDARGKRHPPARPSSSPAGASFLVTRRLDRRVQWATGPLTSIPIAFTGAWVRRSSRRTTRGGKRHPPARPSSSPAGLTGGSSGTRGRRPAPVQASPPHGFAGQAGERREGGSVTRGRVLPRHPPARPSSSPAGLTGGSSGTRGRRQAPVQASPPHGFAGQAGERRISDQSAVISHQDAGMASVIRWHALSSSPAGSTGGSGRRRAGHRRAGAPARGGEAARGGRRGRCPRASR
ncbi:MAG: hypothetical protein KatS3mg119_1093 [Rhodothalassiaceae bacterium]|nr:MAG: hypothetical protein KatS3mg119_1093 [Rhodothalassiaceae bacterium]